MSEPGYGFGPSRRRAKSSRPRTSASTAKNPTHRTRELTPKLKLNHVYHGACSRMTPMRLRVL
jgi:hypothetical protein